MENLKPNYSNMLDQIRTKNDFIDPMEILKNERIENINVSRNSDNCRDVLSPDLISKSLRYENTKFKSWLYVYFSETEENRSDMKKKRNFSSEINLVIEQIPVNFGINSDSSKEHNYWSYKHKQWLESKEINIDDILYVSEKDSSENLKAWLECMKLKKTDNAANFTNLGIYVFIAKVREGRYHLEITNNSISDVSIDNFILDPYITIEDEKKNKLKKGELIGRKGGKLNSFFVTNSKKDESFQINIDVKVKGNNDLISLSAKYEKIELYPEIPIGTIIATHMNYEDFLNANNLQNLTNFDQIWVPCDGRPIVGFSQLSKTPDLRGLFLRGANVMDKNENLHTAPVSSNQKNPDEPIKFGEPQQDGFTGHSHLLFVRDNLVPINNQMPGNTGFNGDAKSYASVSTNSWGNGAAVYNIISSTNGNLPTMHKSSNSGGLETRPKNLSIIYLIKIR